MPESLAPQKIGAIRNIMMEHMQVQRCMIAFNPTFSPFILFSIFNLFAMCVLVFYNAIKVGFEKEEFLLVYFGNGVQILLRWARVKIQLKSFDGKLWGNFQLSTNIT